MLFRNLLLAFQLEQYQPSRFLKFSYTHWQFRYKGSKRQTLDWTKKAMLLFGVSIGILVVGGWLFSLWILQGSGGDGLFIGERIEGIGAIFLLLLMYPLVLVVASFIIFPLEFLLKHRIITQAKRKIQQFPQLVIIGITGSYGKTSVKEILKAMLEPSMQVIATPGTHNTPLGISEFILHYLKEETEVLIVEMGAYLPGDIEQLCEIAQPHMAILTGITFQHLERFKTLDRIIQTKFEITKGLTADSLFITDGENEAVQQGLQRYTRDKPFTIKEIGPLQVQYLPNFEGISFSFEGEKYQTKLLGKHSAKNIALALLLAKHLGVRVETLQNVVRELPFVPHRLEVLHNPQSGILVIDDSFNGNKEGVRSTIDLLQYTPFSGRKVYLTPGLVELGKKADEIHVEIGKHLAKSVDVVLLIDNLATRKMQEGLLEAGFNKNHIQIFSTPLQAHQALKTLLHKGDVIVFQNDIPDNY